MSSNLPPGVTPSMIPGNRPEDIAYDRLLEAAMEALPPGTEELLTALKKILSSSSDLEEISSAANDVVNIFDPEGDDEKLRAFVDAMDEVSRIAGEWMNPPEPEWEPDIDMED